MYDEGPLDEASSEAMTHYRYLKTQYGFYDFRAMAQACRLDLS
jgi:hypothetical protein